MKIDGQEIEKTDLFSYLGSVIDVQGGAYADVKAGIGKARRAFSSLKPIWIRRSKTDLSQDRDQIKASQLKCQVFLYGSET